jgi:diguanylate cyclase (GGDEF)-like protein
MRFLFKIEQLISKNLSIQTIITTIKKELSGMLKNTRVHFIFDDQDALMRAGRKVLSKAPADAFARSFGSYIIKKRNPLVVGGNLEKFCRDKNIKHVRKTTKSVMGVPIYHRSHIYGAIVLENSKSLNAFSREDEIMVTVVAGRVGAEIANGDLMTERSKLEAEISQLALFDPLTELPNQRYFNLIVEMELKKAKGYSRQLSLAMIDLDRFRGINARLGKNVGNKLLVHVAQTLKRNVRDTDFVARYSGEEFVILLPEALNEAAVNVAERVRTAVERAPLAVKGLGKKKVTISVGVATYPSSAENLPALLEQVQKALKKAKQLGRNQVVAL